MLSTLAFRHGGLQALKSLRAVRACATAVATSQEKFPNQSLYPSSDIEQISIEEKIRNWEEANTIFFGPQRDTKNFPAITQEEYPETYQFAFIPTRWFKSIYPKLGVTGGYTLLWGTLAFVISKEILVFGHIMGEVMVHVPLYTYLIYKFGSKIREAVSKEGAKMRKEFYEDPLNDAKTTYNNDIATAKQEIWRQESIPAIFEAKQELVDLQLEAQYRQRLAEVYTTVKQRLDYQLELDVTQRQFEQDHMVRWIVDNVKKSITPQQEKENITSCIATLKKLSATANL